MSKNLQILSIFLTVMMFSCKSPNEEEIIPSSPDLSQPVATGIYITQLDPFFVGVWGNPADGSITTGAGYSIFPEGYRVIADSTIIRQSIADVSLGVRPLPTSEIFAIPYPNPSSGNLFISFSVPVESFITLYIVPARWIDDESKDVNFLAGAVTVTPQRTAAVVPIKRRHSAGQYLYVLTLRGVNEYYLPPGFYRIYLRINNSYYWHDVLFYNEVTDLPVSLRDYVPH
jgi:hypothetical protein